MIPVSIVSGFLGSGKSTLIARILRNPAFARTAVIVNEFGEIGLDHDLIATSDDQVLTLNTGCLCCAVQTDLAATLMTLRERQSQYDRVLIETSGLSDPAPILQSLLSDAGVSATHQVPRVITLIDPIHGQTTLRDHPEARHQVALADHLLISKTDLQPASDELIVEILGLNPAAPRTTTAEASAADLFGAPSADSVTSRLGGLVTGSRHGDIDSFTLIRDRPIPALALTLLLQALAEHAGSRLLRLKGFVAIEEMPGQPAVIHGVRHVVTPPEFLARWPSDDHTTRIVFITKGIPRHFPARLLDAIEGEVRDAQAG